MKLLRFGPKGAEKPGALDDNGAIRDLSTALTDFTGNTVAQQSIDELRKLDLSQFPEVAPSVRMGACLASVPNFHCVGLNYVNHAKESGMEIPKEPILFSKATSALSGPFDPVVIPKGSEKTDWEVELGVVIGRPTSHVSEASALDHVVGYCIINDVSERAFQLELGGQWVKGKSAPTFGPTGPYLVTADEIGDPQTLALSLKVNGDIQQASNTSDMIFSVKEIVSYMSRFMDLMPGDIIATGTPEGVGMGQSPQRWLQPGDVMELEIEGLGLQRQEAKAFS